MCKIQQMSYNWKRISSTFDTLLQRVSYYHSFALDKDLASLSATADYFINNRLTLDYCNQRKYLQMRTFPKTSRHFGTQNQTQRRCQQRRHNTRESFTKFVFLYLHLLIIQTHTRPSQHFVYIWCSSQTFFFI